VNVRRGGLPLSLQTCLYLSMDFRIKIIINIMGIVKSLWGHPRGQCTRFFTTIRSLKSFSLESRQIVTQPVTNATAKHAVVYHEDFKINPIPSNHRFPMPKDALLYQRLVELGIATADRTFTPVPPDLETLCLAHDADYVSSFLDGTISDAAMRSIGLPWSNDLVTRTLIGTGSAILASRLALDLGIAVMCNGGTHHAHPGHGSGWCIFNDQAVAAKSVQRDCSVCQILFIDLDVHQGDGTAAIFQNDSSVFTFSMHCEAQPYPSILQKSDLDVPLPAGCDDESYLSTLKAVLPGVLETVQPELVMYNAGTDVHIDDSLGKMALSINGILERDRLVMKLCSEAGSVLCAAIGGGYENDHEKIVERHVMLHRAAGEYADAFLKNTKRAKKWAAAEADKAAARKQC
jgi:acetoin utilization deacetylase AcuC-like enzyme